MSSLVASPGALDPFEYASDFVRAYCGRRFDLVTNDVELVDPRIDSTGQLSQAPVVSVTSVQAFMVDPTGNYAWQALTNFGWDTRGLLYDTTRIRTLTTPTPLVPWPSWPFLPQSLRVTYTHGYSVIPADIQAVVTRLAGQIAANPNFTQSRKVGDVAAVYGSTLMSKGSTLITLRDTDAAILDRYKVIEVG